MKKSSTLMTPTSMLAAALGLAAVLLSHAAAADETSEAEERFKKGLMLVDEGDCKNAVVEFEESYRLFPAPVVLYNLALCYDDLHQYSKSMKYYKQFMTDAENLTPSQNASIMDRIKKLEKYLGILEINCNIDGASVLIDDEEVGTTPMEAVYVETGQHRLTVRKPDYDDFVKKVKMVSGSTVTVDAELEPADVSGGPGVGEAGDGAKKTKKIKPVVFFSMLGVSLALGAGAAAVGGLNIQAHNDFLDTPYSDTDKWKDLKDKGEMYNIIFLSLIGVTGAALVTTAVLAAFTDFSKLKKGKKGKEKKPVEVGFLPGPDGASVTLRFPLDL